MHLPPPKPREPTGAASGRDHASRWHRTAKDTHKWQIWPPEHN
jgi:hypothetical protein